ncbi:hypothetical protein OG873_32735 [Streptomyces violaceus]|uniref:non-specific serine/threonine protein kinase n=1 Tax=Streptomyces violaceus TaxID=1936 RepID=A0ABZ1P0J8_STRVL|nr:protein kinase [Streptomyces violaceus]
MGTVWLADDEVLGRRVALERLHERPHLSTDGLGTRDKRMRREARSAARIVHPNVIVVHDVVEDEGRPCVVMEYVPGHTLADLLQEGRTLPPHEAVRIGLVMVSALRAAHEAGVLHEWRRRTRSPPTPRPHRPRPARRPHRPGRHHHRHRHPGRTEPGRPLRRHRGEHEAQLPHVPPAARAADDLP